ARRFLVAHHGLCRAEPLAGAAGLRALLPRLRCIQLDPLDRIGTNAELVALARVDGLARGDVYRELLGRDVGFEHFAKQRCILPAHRFPEYRARLGDEPDFQQSERMRALPPALLDAVVAEVRARGPLAARDLSDHGTLADPWQSGVWRGTAKLGTLALRALAMQCRLVVCGRNRFGEQRYDLPERALPTWAHAPAADGATRARDALIHRVHACGLMPRTSGPWWGALRAQQRSDLPERLVRSGELAAVQVEGSRRTYLAPPGFRDGPVPEDDGRMRILGPLDPLLWSRPLVEHAFGFDYVWEVYKPPAQRRWGYYVVPLLHEGHLVGRMAARMVSGALQVEQLWREPDRPFAEAAFRQACERHARAMAQ
ncbi:MAG: winged helix DNA-binding domain-containing protein, partial [Myxococcales bacterium]|nr:winged helix DNA-binding domain-containing protein [Myxococcales bacterium]